MVRALSVFKLPGVTVLVLDASVEIRARLLAMITEAGGIDVHEVGDAESAMSVLSAEEIDLVVLDVHLSKDAGIELLRRIRELAPRIVCIVLTNETSDHHRRECLSHGADFFFDKSRHFERAVSVVKSVAGLRSRRLTVPS